MRLAFHSVYVHKDSVIGANLLMHFMEIVSKGFHQLWTVSFVGHTLSDVSEPFPIISAI